ncbi:MAG: pantoate--beta-alanine ligase [Candidatus Omnitrophica bacterium]|nr:pantoate--beta-alanine ligase [Candidatus Omnitrophota bacterium]
MKIVKDIKKMQEFSWQKKKLGKKIGFIPTMGALHEGHLSLIRKSRQDNDLTVVSIFVNPAQFGPQEDLKKYPRDFKKDAALCAKEKVDVIFFPSPKEMYPCDYKTFITVEGLSDKLCGKSRPGHFRGVATVVAKLFNIVRPDAAYFGLKDAQQAIILKQMSKDLNFPMQIKLCRTKREKDGLAMSSRNIYLNKDERVQALVLSSSLKLAENLIKNRQRDPKIVISRMRSLISTAKDARIDYISVTDLNELEPLKKIKGEVLIALAVRIGKTRLIDNCILNVRN